MNDRVYYRNGCRVDVVKTDDEVAAEAEAKAKQEAEDERARTAKPPKKKVSEE